MKKKQPEDNMELEVMRAFTSRKSDQEMGMPDVEQELARLKARRSDLPRMGGSRGGRLSLQRKVAAILVAALMLTGLSYAAVRTSFFTQSWNEDKAQVAEVQTADADPTEHTAYAPEIKMVGDSVILFKDYRLDSIMMQIDKYYQVESQFADAESRSMRLLFKWNRQHSLEEVLERMNGFERFKVRREENKLIVEQNAAME